MRQLTDVFSLLAAIAHQVAPEGEDGESGRWGDGVDCVDEAVRVDRVDLLGGRAPGLVLEVLDLLAVRAPLGGQARAIGGYLGEARVGVLVVVLVDVVGDLDARGSNVCRASQA